MSTSPPTSDPELGAGESPAGLLVGAFRLESQLGAGAMGHVWAARHEASGERVALKLLSGELSHDATFQAAFRAEVRAVARLSHPGVVAVYDYGTLPDAAADVGLEPGAPWLAMECLDGLLRRPRRAGWPWLRRVLVEILDALAHAHARQVVHRDLKPGNLMSRGGSVCLVDFGLAHAMDADGPDAFAGTAVGTPSYMAPEQITGDALGPWTDLYALGCVAYRYAVGRAPFAEEADDGSQRTGPEIMAAHLTEDVPSVRPRFPTPLGFRDWLGSMLVKEPRFRPRHAADARAALLAIGGELEGGGNDDLATGDFVIPDSLWTDESEVSQRYTEFEDAAHDPEATQAAAPRGAIRGGESPETLVERDATMVSTVTPGVGPQLARPETRHGTADAPMTPPVPVDWRRHGGRHGGRHDTDAARKRTRFSGVGLGIYGLREVPLVGRQVLQDQLWQALVDVYVSGRPAAVLVRGPAGCGKTRLVDWLGRRAMEVGAAEVLTVLHSQIPNPNDGMRAALSRHLDVVRPEPRDTHHRAVDLLSHIGLKDPDEATALAVWLGDGEAAVGFQTPAERDRLALRVLAGLARTERPRIVVLDDAHRDPAAIEFGKRALLGSSPLLVVATVTDEALPDAPFAEAALDALVQEDGWQVVRVGPLSPSGTRELVSRLLGFDSGLAAKLSTRSGGVPSFVVQLVTDWVARGVLVAGPDGFALAPGASAELPDDLLGVWDQRVDGLKLEPDVELALEMAAALGTRIDHAELRAICDAAGPGVAAADACLERLSASGLAVRNDDGKGGRGWRLANVMLRETVARRARSKGRWRSHHDACATTLAARGVDPERLGRHLAEAGELDAALQPLLDGADERAERGEYEFAEVLLARCETIVAALELDASDRRVVDLWTARAWLARLVEDHDASREWSERAIAVATADQCPWPDVRARARLAHARVLRNAGRVDDAIATASTGLADARLARDPILIARCQQTLGISHMVSGRLAEAQPLLDAAHQAFIEAGDGQIVNAGICKQAMAVVSVRSGDVEGALAHIDAALRLYDQGHSRHWKANGYNDRADFLRHLGRLDEAADGYQRSIDIFDSLGVVASVPLLNLGVLALERDQHDVATDRLERSVEMLRTQGRVGLVAQALTYLLACYTGRRDLDAYDRTFEEANRLLEETRVAAVDCGKWAERAGRELAALGHPDRARAAFDMALDQWTRLGRDDDRERVEALVHALDTSADADE